MGSHAFLSPSGASRWMVCTSSPFLESFFPDQTSVYAEEGTHAHELGELYIKKALSLITKQRYKSDFLDLRANKYYSKEMHEYCKDYMYFVLEQVAEVSSENPAHVCVEQRLTLTGIVDEIFGTGDVGIYGDGVLHGIDLKYGMGVEVSPIENAQLMVYMLGWYVHFKNIYGDKLKVRTVKMSIYQPRMNNIGTYEMSLQDLFKWAKTKLIPAAKLALNGGIGYVAGDKHCKFCRANKTCKTLAEYNMQLVGTGNFEIPNQLTDERIAEIARRESLFVSWVKDVKAYALSEAIKGKKYPGLKLVVGKSNRVIKDSALAATALLLSGAEETEVYKPLELKTLSDLEKTFGPGGLAKILESILIKPGGAPALVSELDTRMEYKKAKAFNDFKNFLNK